MSHVFTARPRPHVSAGAAVALDFGLRVRIEANPAQRALFSGAETLTAQQLTAELAELVSSLRVRSFALRHELEQLTSALLVNVDCGFPSLARRAALDLGDLLRVAARRRLADPELCLRGANCSFRIAELIVGETR
jgi:hypothetical protein